MNTIKPATSDIAEGWQYSAVRGHTKEQVAEAVSDPEWQKVRLSMKGKTTAQKLLILKEYYEKVFREPTISLEEALDIQCRVDNYLGALRRGGQLDMNNMIRKER